MAGLVFQKRDLAMSAEPLVDPYKVTSLCQCPKGRQRCQRNATQEDMRCNLCRQGCSQVHIEFGDGRVLALHHTEMRMTPITKLPSAED
jgi:hypothetical protein